MNHEDITNGLESPPVVAPTSECCGAKVDLLASIPLCVQCNGQLVAPRLTGKHYEVFPGRHLPGHNERCGLEWPKPPRDLAAVIDAMLAEIPEGESWLRADLEGLRRTVPHGTPLPLTIQPRVAQALVAGASDEPWYERVMAIWSGEAAPMKGLPYVIEHPPEPFQGRPWSERREQVSPEPQQRWHRCVTCGEVRNENILYLDPQHHDWACVDPTHGVKGHGLSPTGDTPNLAGEAWAFEEHNVADLAKERIDAPMPPSAFDQCADCGGAPQLILLAQDCAKCVRCFILSGMNARCFMCGKNPTEAIVRAVGPSGQDDTVGTCINCLLAHVSAGRN